MIQEVLLQYGVAGVFILYLIYDRQVIIRGLTKSMDRLTKVIGEKL